MHRWLLLIMIALLPLRGWVGDAMAGDMIEQRLAVAVQTAEVVHDCPGHEAAGVVDERRRVADRIGQAEQLAAGEHFNPEIGFMRRQDFRRSFGQLRLSRRPRSVPKVRRLSGLGNFEYLTNSAGRVGTRQGQLQFTAELESTDQFVGTYTNYYEFLDDPFRISTGVTLPTGGYSYQDANLSYALGPQRKASATVAIRKGSFYDGDINALEISAGRIELSPVLQAMGVPPEVGMGAIRFSLGRGTTAEEIDETVERLAGALAESR